jgi:tRNA-dihydrouridine synthase B
MWRIGDLNIDGRVVLGPMSGFSSSGYRDFMKPFGVALSMTEMVSDMGVIHSIARTDGYIRFGPNHPTGLQLFGSNPERLAQAAAKAVQYNPNIDLIDVNMGCPVAKVLRSGSGSLLMRDPVRCGEIIREIKRSVDVPVTAKIRLGYDNLNINFRTVISELEAAGVDAICVHPRTRTERYLGVPHYDMVQGLRSEMSVPLIISGNIFSLDDAINALEITGAEGVMVARGGVGNPFLVTQIDHYLRTGETLPNPTIAQQVDWCMQLADMIVEEKGEDAAFRKLRSFAPKFVAGCTRCRQYRLRLATETVDRDSLAAIMGEIRDRLGDERIRTQGCPLPIDANHPI